MGCCKPFTYASDRTTNGITATCNDEKIETAIKKYIIITDAPLPLQMLVTAH